MGKEKLQAIVSHISKGEIADLAEMLKGDLSTAVTAVINRVGPESEAWLATGLRSLDYDAILQAARDAGF